MRRLTGIDRRWGAQVLRHSTGRRAVAVDSVVVPDKAPTQQDVEIASRLLRAYHAGSRPRKAEPAAGRRDVWSIIGEQQTGFALLLQAEDPETLARYLCNVSRHDASVGIVQGHQEHARIVSDRSYRQLLAVMAKDKLVSLAEAVGCLPVENPEQGRFGMNLHADVNELVAGISERVGMDIAPPDIDGGLLKLRTDRGLFGERDANALFTAWLLRSIVRRFGARRICEIGAGSGRVAYWSRRLGVGSHTIIDLPLVNVVQGYYLLKSLPAERVVLYGEAAGDEPAGVTVWPNHAIDELPNPEFDLVLNQDSMPEMHSQTVDEYLGWICRVCRGGLFLSINHESKPDYGENLRHVNVSEAVHAAGGFELMERYPYWLRRGYVVELYRSGR